MILAYSVAALALLAVLLLPGTWSITLPVCLPLIAVFLWGMKDYYRHHY